MKTIMELILNCIALVFIILLAGTLMMAMVYGFSLLFEVIFGIQLLSTGVC